MLPAEAFEERHLQRNDGDKVIPASLALVAALESGHRLKLSSVEEAAGSAKYCGFLTKEEFVALCEKNPDNCLDASVMAKHVSVLAPDGFFTRASLQEVALKAGSTQDSLSADEVDALFDLLDDENTGSISAERLMEAVYGEEGKVVLAKQRKEYATAKAEEERQRAAREAAAAAAAAAAASKKEEPKQAPPPPTQTKKKTMCGC
ncbi:I/6 autoantigen [Trypanosoma rangeli]|uniref:I/6 autoantigen n=1 Tax=Trypanosoma rangeli TaxID=5698 RepID=A0A422N4A4_TRYRA|nr:I/6 autoantigen [Trypanosoma rangeli]RNF00284.1 I/6 autoantigen [Trypanosoma rangeli]|eukprot:RNF00284.1 I/6 autoantigen [Trypanosoma rangeli]